MLKHLIGLAATTFAITNLAFAEGEKAKPFSPDHTWYFSGLQGQHEIAQVQRGFQAFWAKCASCHGMEFRRFWHLEKIGYTESEVKSILAEYLISQGETFDSSTYSIQNFPASRAASAPDLSHAVLAKGKTMEQGADYIYSLLLGYDRINDAVLGPAIQTEINEDAAAYRQVGETAKAFYDDGNLKSETTRFEKDNFYLYGGDEDWVLRDFVDIRTDIQEYDRDGNALPLKQKFSHRLDETDTAYAAADTANHEGDGAPQTAAQAWATRDKAHYHEVAAWASGQYYNPFKSGGILSMRSPLVDLESFHRTDFTPEELAQDASELENAAYWLLANQELQPQLLELVPALQEAYAAIPAGETPATDRDFFEASQPVQKLLDKMQPESKEAIAEDIAAFLAWSSDINLTTRKQTGLYIVLLFGILSILLYFYYREVAKHEFAKQTKEGGPWDENH